MLREALTFDRLQTMSPGDASAYFVSRSVEGLNASEQELLDNWLIADTAHVAALERATRAWHCFDDADNDEILTAMRAHARAATPRRLVGWIGLRQMGAIAAAFLVIVATSLVLSPLLHQTPGGGRAVPQQVWTHYASARSDIGQFTLPDGSSMTLDADSLAEARFEGAERAVRLVRGRGLFEVRKDPARPFAVGAASRRVVALGTRFEVDVTANALRVTLFRGSVAVKPRAATGQTFVLRPGQQFVERDGVAGVREAATSQGSPDWVNGLLRFNDTSLADAARQINRRSTVQITISPAAAAIHVSGQFRAGDGERFARTVSEVYPVELVKRGDAIEIVAKKK
jgi:transmembrane sensor